MARGKGQRGRGARSRGVVEEIDSRLAELDRELEGVRGLMAERRRLLTARAAVTGERSSPAGGLVRKVTQDEVADFLFERPGSRAGVIAGELGVPLTTISQHLHRGKETRFERREDGWHLREGAS